MQEKNIKKRVFNLIQIGEKGDLLSRLFDYFIVFCIVANLTILVLETYNLPTGIISGLKKLEYFTLVVFIIEYILRIWTAECLYPNRKRIESKIYFIFSFYGLVDLLSILPYFLPIIFPSGMVAFKVLRVFRVFRLFRVNSQYDAFNVVLDVLIEKKQQLFSSVCLIFIMMLASSVCMYSLEHNAQPDLYQNAFSGMWWSVSALLTVGYGDIYPVTTMGRIFAIIISFLGVGMVAIPTGIISAGFVEHYTRIKSMAARVHRQDLKYIFITLEHKHPWVGKKVRAIQMPPEFMIASVFRNREICIPDSQFTFKENDKVILATNEYKDDIGVLVEEVHITDEHEWVGKNINQLSVPRDSMIVLIFRDNEGIEPSGGIKLLDGDTIVVIRKRSGD